MRKLLILLSVVVLFAICQSKTTHGHHSHHKHPDCIFGYKKVDGKKQCKTIEEFFQNPRNETNCTAKKQLKCLKFNNATACLCLKKSVKIPQGTTQDGEPTNPRKCLQGYVYNCVKDHHTRHQECKCRKLSPVLDDPSSETTTECPEGQELYCGRRGKCLCRKVKHDDDDEPVHE